MKKKFKSIRRILFYLGLLIVTSSFQVSGCIFGWCDSGDPIITQAPGGGNGTGETGNCVVYQPQTYRIFGINFGSRNHEYTILCHDAYK